MFKFLSVLLFISNIFLVPVYGVEDISETKVINNTEIESFDTSENKIDINEKINITVDLKDNSRFMGINVYQVGTYDGQKFLYKDEYKALVDRDYYNINRESEKQADVEKFYEYLDENKDVIPTAKMEVRKGFGKIEGLPLGIYLLRQNEEDKNARLTSNILVEAPQISLTLNRYIYEIDVLPRWENVAWFSFRPEVINPLITILGLIICFLLSFFGSTMFQSLFYSASFLFLGLIGFNLGKDFLSEYIWLMVIFLISAFIGIGLLWMVIGLIAKIKFSKRISRFLRKQLIWITPIVAFYFASQIIKNNISENFIFSIIIPAVISASGMVVQFVRRKHIKVFYTYDDLLNLKRTDEVGIVDD